MRTMNTRVWPVAALAVVAVAALMGSCAEPGPPSAAGGSTDAAAQTTGTPAKILQAVDSPRLSSVDAVGSTAEVTGEASTSPGDATRTLWYATVAGAALAHVDGLDKVERRVLDASGSTLDRETDPVALTKEMDPFAPLTLSSSEIRSQVDTAAASIDAKVVDVHYVALFGGAAEVVVQPDDVAKFV